MGQLTLPKSGTVYVDTNAIVYRVERIEPYLTASAPLWDALDQGSVDIETSELTLLEVLVKPLKDGNASLEALFRDVLLETAGLSCLPISRQVIERAARLRATHGLKTPDAIHAATAARRLSALRDERCRVSTGLGIARRRVERCRCLVNPSWRFVTP